VVYCPQQVSFLSGCKEMEPRPGGSESLGQLIMKSNHVQLDAHQPAQPAGALKTVCRPKQHRPAAVLTPIRS
jgi:hypothetical protein